MTGTTPNVSLRMLLKASQDVPNMIKPMLHLGIGMIPIASAVNFSVVVRRDVHSHPPPAISVLDDAVGVRRTCFIPS